jgi:hypothetical protein
MRVRYVKFNTLQIVVLATLILVSIPSIHRAEAQAEAEAETEAGAETNFSRCRRWTVKLIAEGLPPTAHSEMSGFRVDTSLL